MLIKSHDEEMLVMKRSKKEVPFDGGEIYIAIQKANSMVAKEHQIHRALVVAIEDEITDDCRKYNRTISTDEIGDMVEEKLIKYNAYPVAKQYITYRYKHQLNRQKEDIFKPYIAIVERQNEEVKQENANKNPTINSVQRDYMAGEVSRELTGMILDPDILEAHEDGIIHFHDTDYFAQYMHNCCLVNLDDMLQNGTVISDAMIKKPKTFKTACNIATQCIAQIASQQYGGQTISLAHLIPFVQASRDLFTKQTRERFQLAGIEATDDQVKKVVEAQLDEEIKGGVQLIQYQLITLMTTNGQAPFVSLYMYINECKNEQEKADFVRVVKEILMQRIDGVENEQGVKVTPAFPKLLYVLTEDNTREDGQYYWLTQLAAKCSAKRLVPDYISEKIMLQTKGDVYPCMGCRSFLTPDRTRANIANAKNYNIGEHKYYGRFNQGVVTINLVDVACSSYGDEEEFWKIFDERLELCYRALMARHNRLLGTPSDVAPILWQHGALARLKKGEPIDALLYGGYSTISLGYAGLYECTVRMTNESHTNPNKGKPFAMKVMQHMNDKCAEWKKKTDIDFSLYGTPLESTTYKFAKCLQRRFGIIPDVTDRNYITNSYHVHVTEKIDAFTKLKFESEFQALSPGGAISYVEVPDMNDNIEGVLSIIKFIYNNIMYAELNTKSDYCMKCGYDGEIKIVEERNKLIWECPHCKNRNPDMMSVARRTCGYIGTAKNGFNQGRTSEIRDRVLHLSTHNFNP